MRQILDAIRQMVLPPPVSRVGAVPPGTRVYAVGDIHGRHDLLGRVHRSIVADAAGCAATRRVAVYLGDFIDRGTGSREVIDLLVETPLEGFESVFLRGNHDDWLLRFLADPRVGQDWLVNGGDATLLSYGVGLTIERSARDAMGAARDALRDALPPAHLEFLRRLAPSHVEGDYGFVHAGIRPGVPLGEQAQRDLLWIREPFLRSRVRHDHIIVHGHNISAEPEVRAHRIGIDTGAFASGRLTCLVLEGEARRFLPYAEPA